MATPYQSQNGLGETETIVKLRILVQQIETQSGFKEEHSMLYGKSLKMLSAEPRIILNIVEREYNAASDAQKREMLCGLEDRMKEFDETLLSSIEFVERLSERRAVWATVFRKHDLKMIKAHHEEVKKRGEEIERGITRLKTRWSDHATFVQGVAEPPNSLREQQPESSSSVPTLPPTNQAAFVSAQPEPIGFNSPPSTTTPMMRTRQASSPTTSLSQATIQGSAFHSIGNDMLSTTIYDYSRWDGVRNTIVHGNQYIMHFHNEGQDSRND